MQVYIGTAGWTLPKEMKPRFPASGTHLERYARVFNAVEVNSSFYRDHRAETYARWADSVPPEFRFSVKLSRDFIHKARLRIDTTLLRQNLSAIASLGSKWGALLVQLPPSLEFEREAASDFLAKLKTSVPAGVGIFWEPRHPSWGRAPAVELLQNFGIDRVDADPEPCPRDFHRPATRRYLRWHGTPEVYRSDYSMEQIVAIAQDIAGTQPGCQDLWCIFDNTTFGHATRNALELEASLRSASQLFQNP